jgi:hypothetical protein
MTKEEKDKELILLEHRKIKALEKIAVSLESISIWIEEIDKEEWSDRIQFYLSEWRKTTCLSDDEKKS